MWAANLYLLAFLSNPSWELFPGDKTCACIRTHKHTARLTSTVVHEGKQAFQVFRNAQTRQEVFRVDVGGYYDDQWLTFWNYGIARTADFNQDGIEDYAWYGGDDTSHLQLLFLSSATGYRGFDVIDLLSAAYTRYFQKKAPDLYGAGEGLNHIRLENLDGRLYLAARYTPEGQYTKHYSLRIQIDPSKPQSKRSTSP